LLICPGGPVTSVIGGIGHVVTKGAGAATNAVMEGVVSWAADGAAWLITQVGKQIERSTRPALTSGWFTERYTAMAMLAIALAGLFLLFAVIQAIIAQDVSLLLRAAFISLPTAMFLTFAAVTLIGIGLALTDWMTAVVLSGTRGEVGTAFDGLGKVLAATGPSPLAPFVLFLSSLIVSLLSLLVWLELTMREAAVYVGVAYLPLTLVAMIWPKTAHWCRRLTEWLTAIVLSKFTIAGAFALAAAAIVDAPSSGGGLSAVLAGCSVLLIAAMTPWALLKLMPFAEAAAGSAITRGTVVGAAMAVPGAGTATAATRTMMMRNLGSGPGAAAASSASSSPTAPPSPPSDGGPTLPTLPTLPRQAERTPRSS
jgi:hypothetical protein